MGDNVSYTPEEQRFVKSLPPEIQKIIHETKTDYPGWTAVRDANAKLMGYSWTRTEKPTR
jgi:hypothetical protein